MWLVRAVYTNVCMYVHACMRAYVCACMHACICMCICVCVCVDTLLDLTKVNWYLCSGDVCLKLPYIIPPFLEYTNPSITQTQMMKHSRNCFPTSCCLTLKQLLITVYYYYLLLFLILVVRTNVFLRFVAVQPHVNVDGTMYRYDPAQPPPWLMGGNLAVPPQNMQAYQNMQACAQHQYSAVRILLRLYWYFPSWWSGSSLAECDIV